MIDTGDYKNQAKISAERELEDIEMRKYALGFFCRFNDMESEDGYIYAHEDEGYVILMKSRVEERSFFNKTENINYELGSDEIKKLVRRAEDKKMTPAVGFLNLYIRDNYKRIYLTFATLDNYIKIKSCRIPFDIRYSESERNHRFDTPGKGLKDFERFKSRYSDTDKSVKEERWVSVIDFYEADYNWLKEYAESSMNGEYMSIFFEDWIEEHDEEEEECKMLSAQEQDFYYDEDEPKIEYMPGELDEPEDDLEINEGENEPEEDEEGVWVDEDEDEWVAFGETDEAAEEPPDEFWETLEREWEEDQKREAAGFWADAEDEDGGRADANDEDEEDEEGFWADADEDEEDEEGFWVDDEDEEDDWVEDDEEN